MKKLLSTLALIGAASTMAFALMVSPAHADERFNRL